jgi:hypothetical protein
VLVITAAGVAVILGFAAWSTGRALKLRTEGRQVRLRMSDGLSVHGGSAGLAFSLNCLLATYRSHPLVAARSWLWKRFFYGLRSATQTWAATGIVDADGGVDHVVLEPKIRACLRSPGVTDVLTPWQAKEAGTIEVAATAKRWPNDADRDGSWLRFRQAAQPSLRSLNQSVMAVGDFTSKSQIGDVLGLAVTVMIARSADFVTSSSHQPRHGRCSVRHRRVPCG